MSVGVVEGSGPIQAGNQITLKHLLLADSIAECVISVGMYVKGSRGES